jgi:hypothetical protein
VANFVFSALSLKSTGLPGQAFPKPKRLLGTLGDPMIVAHRLPELANGCVEVSGICPSGAQFVDRNFISTSSILKTKALTTSPHNREQAIYSGRHCAWPRLAFRQDTSAAIGEHHQSFDKNVLNDSMKIVLPGGILSLRFYT